MLTRRTSQSPARDDQRGYALLLVMVFTAVGLVALSSALRWSSNSLVLVGRHNDFQANLAAAEAVLEKAAATMTSDFLANDETYIYANLSRYQNTSVSLSEAPEWGHLTVSGGAPSAAAGAAPATPVLATRSSAWQFGPLETKFTGLQGYSARYTLTTGVSDSQSMFSQPARLQQTLQLASIPLFSFGIFSGMDLEICPSRRFTILGRVHANGNVYCFPDGNEVTFADHVTATHDFRFSAHPDDPVQRNTGRYTARKEIEGGVASLRLPLDPADPEVTARAIIEVPPAFESPTSVLGRQRLYNKADMIVVVGRTNVLVTSGRYNNFAITLPPAVVSQFIFTNNASGARFYNPRETREVQSIRFKMNAFVDFYSTIRSYLGRDPKTVFVHDTRTLPAGVEPGVVIFFSATIPSAGFTLATPLPIYVEGDYNVYSQHRGTTNTTLSAPSALIGDAMHVLSDRWNDSRSYDSLDRRNARAVTLNSAVITGIVPTRGGNYSGGFENSLRLMEDWSNDQLTFNGSLVVLWESAIATAPWGGPDVYDAPAVRLFSWDTNFRLPSKLPPSTPELRAVLRADWGVARSN